MPIPLRVFQKIEEEGTLPNLFFDVILPWYQNQTKILLERKSQANISGEYKCKNNQQNISKLNSTIYKNYHTPWSSGIYSRDAISGNQSTGHTILTKGWIKVMIISKWKVRVSVTQSCPTLCDPMNCSPSGFSVHRILQARILKWVAIPFSQGSSWPRDWTWVSYTAGRFFTLWLWAMIISKDAKKAFGKIQHPFMT